jgi:hypothetical protein
MLLAQSNTKNGRGASMKPSPNTGRCMMYKEFNLQTHSKYDEAARSKAKAFWKSNGYKCTDNEDIYGVDLIVEGKGRKFNCEVEVKQTWHGLKFQYDTLHIPVRKAKFLGDPTTFMVFNAGLHRVAVVGRKAVQEAPRVEVPNREIAFGERFFDVPVTQAKFFTIGA